MMISTTTSSTMTRTSDRRLANPPPPSLATRPLITAVRARPTDRLSRPRPAPGSTPQTQQATIVARPAAARCANDRARLGSAHLDAGCCDALGRSPDDGVHALRSKRGVAASSRMANLDAAGPTTAACRRCVGRPKIRGPFRLRRSVHPIVYRSLWRRRAAARRLHDQPAGCQKPVSVARPQLRKKGARGLFHAAHRTNVE